MRARAKAVEALGLLLIVLAFWMGGRSRQGTAPPAPAEARVQPAPGPLPVPAASESPVASPIPPAPREDPSPPKPPPSSWEASVEGLVTDADTLAPLAGARICLLPVRDSGTKAGMDQPIQLLNAESGSDGRFALHVQGLWEGCGYRLSCAKDDYREPDSGMGPFPSLAPGERRDHRLALRAGVTIEVSLVTLEGRPVPAYAQVDLIHASRKERSHRQGTHNGKARFVLPRDESLGEISIRGSAEGYAASEAVPVGKFPRTGDSIQASVTLQEGGWIQAQLTYEGGTPCPRGEAWCWPASKSWEEALGDGSLQSWSGVLPPDGGVTFKGLPGNGPYLLFADAEDAFLEVPQRVGPGELAVLCLRKGGTITGRCVDKTGHPLPGHQIQADSDALLLGARVARLDGEGRFVLRGLPLGKPLTLGISAPGRLAVQKVWEGTLEGPLNLELTSSGK